VGLDVSAVRAAYPALADGYAYLDGAAGTQVPAPVIDAISGAHRSGLGNSDGAFPASARSGAIVAGCRQAVADLVGGHPAGVILGPNMTTLTYRLAATLAKDWRPGDEVIVSRLDHDANIRPWVQAAGRAGAVVRWAEMDLPAGELPAGQYDALLSERTRLVAVTAASTILGTRPDVAAITAKARPAGALRHRVLQRGRPDPAGGRGASGGAECERLGRGQLRLGTCWRAWHQGYRRRGPRGAGALQRPLRCGPVARGRFRTGRLIASRCHLNGPVRLA